jgi:tetratricopeptide (TPR) repeat protein/CHAT domain-containing protein
MNKKKKIIFVLFIIIFFISIQGNVFGQSEDEALRLFNHGRNAFKYGKYNEALNYFKESLEIYRKLNIPKYISINLNNIGFVYYSLGQYEKALNYYEESLKICRKLKMPQGIAASLNNIGLVYDFPGQYEKALNYFEESLKIYRKLKIPQHIAISLNNIGRVYKSLGQYEKALNYYEESLKIKRKNNLSPGSIATSLNNIGGVYYFLGQYEKALNYYEESLKIDRTLKIPQDIATSLNNIGLVYKSFGQYEKALNYYEESLKIERKNNLSPGSLATSLNNIGEVYSSLGQYEKALNYYEESLKIYRKLKIPQGIAASLNNIGEVYRSLGQYEKALNYYEESLKIDRTLNVPQDIATSLNNIGEVYSFLGQYEKALNYYEESLKIFRKLKTPQKIAKSLNNIGLVFLARQEYKKAGEKFYEAEEEKKKLDVKFKGNPCLVELYLATERYHKALLILNGMTPTWRSRAPYLIQLHTQKGLALKGRKMFKEAAYDFLKAISITEEMRHRIKERAGFLGAGGFKGRIRSYRGLIEALSERAIRGEKKDEKFTLYGKDMASSAFYFMESTKARVLLESMAESEKQKRKIELPKKFREKEQNLLNQLSAVESQWEVEYKKGKEAFTALLERKKKLTAELNSLIKEIRETFPKYAALYYPKPIPPEELPLRDNEALIEYAIGDDAIYVFVVKKGGVKKLIKIPVGREALEEKVKSFMEPLNTNQYQDFSIDKAKELYDILLSKVLKEVKEDEKIIIIPDGILGLLPFEALVLKAGTNVIDSLYVGDKYSLNYYQSATVMAFQRRFKGKKAEKAVFALGNPVYSERDTRYIAFRRGKSQPDLPDKNISQYAFRSLATRREWGKTNKGDIKGKEIVYTPLPETEIEVKAIANLFGIQPLPPDVLISVLANETEFRKVGLDKYRYIHFATHADLPGRVQGIQEPFLLLGQVENQGKDDGFLTMSEVLGLKLNADLVVLSACVTGVGKQMEGEGVVNFARAFQYAGAESVVVSLWEVASKEAVEFMTIFYGYLKAGKSRSESLGLARKEIKSKYPNPFYWAVFILHGEE